MWGRNYESNLFTSGKTWPFSPKQPKSLKWTPNLHNCVNICVAFIQWMSLFFLQSTDEALAPASDLLSSYYKQKKPVVQIKSLKSVFVLEWNGPHQLLKVVLHSVGINYHTNGYQCVKGKVKDLVAEERNDPSSMLLYRKDRT